MADEWVKKLREFRDAGVKRIVFTEPNPGEERSPLEVEFFEPAPHFGALDLDTIVPPEAAGDTERPPAPPKLAPALSRVLKRGSVS